MNNIAIIGAGFSGCYLSSELTKSGHNVVIFEKSRGVGGRMATRSIGEIYINHGTENIECTQESFAAFCDNLVKCDILEKSHNGYHSKTLKSNDILKYLSKNATIVTNTLIKEIQYKDNRYSLIDEHGNIHIDFDKVIITAPAPQIVSMNTPLNDKIKENLSKVTYNPIALLAIYSDDIDKLNLEKIKALKDVKKVYEHTSHIVILMNEEFSSMDVSFTKVEFEDAIIKLLQYSDVGFDANIHKYFSHLWRYGTTKTTYGKDFEKDGEIYIVSDWMVGGGVEKSFVSSVALLASIGERK